jgi:hypothetical protein
MEENILLAETLINGEQTDNNNSTAERTVDAKTVKATTSLISATEISWMKRRMEEAYNRYDKKMKELEAVSRLLETKWIRTDAESRKLTPVEIETCKAKKQDLGFIVSEAREDYVTKKREFKNATQQNNRMRRADKRNEKDIAKLLSVINTLINDAKSQLADARSGNHAERVNNLEFLACDQKRKDFRGKVVDLLVELNKERWEKALSFKEVQTKIVGNLYDSFRPNKATGLQIVKKVG